MIGDVSWDPEIAIVTSKSISGIRETEAAGEMVTADLLGLQTLAEVDWGQNVQGSKCTAVKVCWRLKYLHWGNT